MFIRRCIRALALIAGCLCLVKCTAPQPAPIHSAFEGVPATVQIDPQFRTGLDKLTTDQGWPLVSAAHEIEHHTFDWVLLGVKVHVDGQTRVWFVRVAEVIDPLEAQGGRQLRHRRFEYSIPFGVGAIPASTDFAIRCRRMQIEMYDENGEFKSTWSRLTPVVFPNSTLFTALSFLPIDRPHDLPAGAVANIHGQSDFVPSPQMIDVLRDESLYSMVANLQAIGTTPPITPIRDLVKSDIVAVPSMVSLLFNGLRPTLSTTLASAQPLEFPWVFGRVNVPCYEAKFSAYLAGARFFDCRVIAGPSVPPCDLLNGLLVIEIAHPDKPENRMTVRVLASSRTQPAWSPEDVEGYRGVIAQR